MAESIIIYRKNGTPVDVSAYVDSMEINRGDVTGQTAFMQWSPVSTLYSPYFSYELQYKKSTDANYIDVSTNLSQLYAYLKSRMWQKETVYIDSLKKEIIAYVEVKKIERNNSGDRNLYSLSIEVQEA